ncbi:hypothetical protein [Actinomadura rayongensis]|uniref:Integral membrane protein n=1 Tax=Actinomadura rayongensis TaxID=1429076 RepID=A0A6I4WDG4_9ACTN|nr:hypothetical protein [Actinomadura rayongensis]MXQ65044.1 hypothetical protein [Actinomadura rayongensis]
MNATAALRAARLLTALYLGLCVLTLAAAVLLRHHASLVTDAVWTRGAIVTVSAAVTFAAAVRAARGSRPAYRRLRIISAVTLAAVVVLVALPGLFPLWMRLEQSVCGLLLLGVVALVNREPVRSRFAAAR